jgi:predicted DCC family thiol-disulfide oxidoreductase YuxK
MANQPPGSTVIFYDGVCGLCNRLNQFLLRGDSQARIRFAALQSPVAAQLLARHGLDPSDLDTVYVIADWGAPSERVLARSRAVLHALSQLGGSWRALARVASLVPSPLADVVYRAVARNRYRIFGSYDRCQIPPPEWRERFLDQ